MRTAQDYPPYYNVPYIIGDAPELERPALGSFDGQIVCRDNRNFGRRDVQCCQVGDLYQPWYYFRDTGRAETFTQEDVNRICLVYRITEHTVDPVHLHPAYFVDVNNYAPAYRDSLDWLGQLVHVDCVQHRGDVPDIQFYDGSGVRELHVFEGHHRVATLQALERQAKIRLYHLYDMAEPIDVPLHYHANYGDEFWTVQPQDPLFLFDRYEEPDKFQSLRACFTFLKERGFTFTHGVDIGCAEGAHSVMAHRFFGIDMLGIDTEAGRILRGLLMRMRLNLPRVQFEVCNWDEFDRFHLFDFAVCTSVTHHMRDLPGIMRGLAHMDAMVFEVRHGVPAHEIGRGSVIGTQSPEEFSALCARFGYTLRLVDQTGDRHFYAVWRAP